MGKITKKIFFRFLIALTILLHYDNRCYGQLPDLKFDHLTTANGLSQNTITGIAKDKYGFMWFGTWAGLCRYDGYRFRVYQYEQGNRRSLISNRVDNVSIDANKDLWIVAFNDTIYCKYRYETDDFERIPAHKLSKEFKRKISRNGHLANAAVTYKDYKWDLDKVGKDLVQIELSSGKTIRYRTNPVDRESINDQFATDLYLDDQHILWVGTFSNGINRANLDAKPFQHIYHDPWTKNAIIDKNVRAITEDLQGNLWIGTRDKGITIISRQGKYTHLQENSNNPNAINSNYIKTIYCDSRGYIWIGTLRGLDGYDPKTGKLKHYKGSGLGDAHVFNAFEDHLHQIWFASWNGIYKYVPQKDTLIRQNAPGIPNKWAMVVTEDSAHQIWVGTEGGGAAVFKQKNDQDLQLVRVFIHDDAEKSLSDNKVYFILADSKKYIWLGTANGLDRFDPQTRSFKHFTAAPNGLLSATISGIIEDNQGRIWVNHTKGISKINKDSFSIRNFSKQDGLGNDFSDGFIYKSKQTGMLFFGGNNGYDTFYPEKIKVDRSTAKVVLTELQVLNRPVEVNDTVNGRILLQKPLYLTKEIELNHLDKSIAIEFAALHFANPSANKYAYRLEGFDKDWIYTDAANRTAVYSNLSRGHYTFKVRASNSDGIWNSIPTTLSIIVFPPWWASTVAYICYTIIFIVLFYAFYYYSLRVERLKNKLAYENLLHEKEIEFHQSKIDFFTNISHEIKTPLSLILAPIGRMMMTDNLSSLMKDQLTIMRNSGDRLLRLINQLLDIRRFETGNDILQLGDEELVVFLQRIVSSFRDITKERGIFLNFETSVPTVVCRFDADKVEKVMYNLLSNALKFTADHGKIEVRLQMEGTDGNWICVQVSDDGLLIREDDFEAIFKPFQQAGSHQKGGTGLGLAYSKALAELHGGSIKVNSETKDGENLTTFTLKLPLIDSLSLAMVTNSINGQIEVSNDNPLQPDLLTVAKNDAVILIVEDDPDLRNYLVGFFNSYYQVIEANNGSDGLLKAEEELPDLIISDMMMPEMDGLELCRRLKLGTATSHIPVILLTARTPIEFQVKGAENGADDYMTKPFNLQLLSLKVKNLLQVRRTLQEKYKGKMIIQPADIDPVSPDEKLLKKVLAFVEEKIGDPELDVAEICTSIGLSRTQLYRKMKALTGLSMAEIIRDIRLERAKQLLANKKFNVNEICYMVGFSDVDYFRRIFKLHVGESPSAYAKKFL